MKGGVDSLEQQANIVLQKTKLKINKLLLLKQFNLEFIILE